MLFVVTQKQSKTILHFFFFGEKNLYFLIEVYAANLGQILSEDFVNDEFMIYVFAAYLIVIYLKFGNLV